VVVYNSVEGKASETTMDKVDNTREVQVTEFEKDTAEGHVSVEEVTGVQGVTVTFQRSYEGSYIIQKLVIAALFLLQDGKGKFRGLFNLKHLKPYLENKIEKYKSKDIVELQKAPTFMIKKEQAEIGL
jgi:uncharacterized membrane protein (UPF0127 family)